MKHQTISLSLFLIISIFFAFVFAVNACAQDTISLTSPSNGTDLIAVANPTFSANATASSGVSLVTFYDWGTILNTISEPGPYSFVGNDINPGTHVLTAVVTGNDGTTMVSAPVTLEVDCNEQTGVTFSGGLQGWGMFSNNINYGVSGGNLAMTVVNNNLPAGDPYIYGPDYICADACIYTEMQVTEQNTTTDDTGEFYFSTMADGTFGQTKSYVFATTPVTTPTNAVFTTYTVNLTTNPLWTGTIRQIRLDPGHYITPDVTPGASNVFNVSSIVLVAAPTGTCPPTPTNTPLPTPTFTFTPSPTPSSTLTNTPTSTPTITPTNTPTITLTNTVTNTPTLTPVFTFTTTPTSTTTNTFTPTLTWTKTITPTISATWTPIVSPSETPPLNSKVWPNPFTPEHAPNNVTHFILSSTHGAGQLIVVDLRRRKVRDFNFLPGQDVQWDGRDDNGNIVSSGVYIYLLESDSSVNRGTVTVMR